MQTGKIIDAAQQFVEAQYQQHPHPRLIYHNLIHTRQVVQATSQIAAHYHLEGDDLEAVYVAAWFHDIGYLSGPGQQHEERGAEAAVSFLRQQGVAEALQEKVSGCILATRMPQVPTNLIEQITCDADLFHLGSPAFKDRNKLLRKEAEMVAGKEISSATWTETTLLFMEQHRYHTTYAQALLKQQKEENMDRLRNKLEKQKAATAEVSSANLPTVVSAEALAAVPAATQLMTLGKEGKKGKKDKKKDKEKKPERGIETMFRTTSSNHIRLSSMADSKANIMISVNSIIISIILSVLLRKLEDNPNLVIPAIIFLCTSVTTIIFAVLATRPNVTNGRFTQDDIREKRTNLLFFGNFHEMALKDYDWGMKEMMQDANYLYGSMIQDIYHLGVVLGRKYRLLRIAYNVFMFGLVISVLAFTIAVIFFPIKD
ncbi:HD domain-containing protein [Chitinophaga pendula]|uniref:Pycsar system effector family protein n=1 Tax=Chitinophaga TaxID=79328 RepID=UPI000BAF4249|nr:MULTISPECIES: Pycsar system effector family protein [Chitinophaga]ASZ10954.1 phosphohydrolase [Chitinophaga sp. MD30]UCJ06057.1 HD domain-containing protein [Chitinophaga pendula]